MAETLLWLGNQETHEAYRAALDKAHAHPRFSADVREESTYLQRMAEATMLSVQNGVAVVAVNGSLVTGSAGYALLFGATGYDDLRHVLIKAATDPGVNSILLNVNSGGGAVGGIQDAANLIARVRSAKPVVAYTGSIMASSALWLGRQAEYVVAADTAVVGSVGVLQVHVEYSKQLEQEGVTATVVRGGEQKALANRYEPLSPKAKENMEKQAKHLYDVFLGAMAKATNLDVEVAEAKFGQGREFIGSQAKSAGLVDKVGTFEEAFAKAQVLGEASAKKRTPKNKGVQSGMSANLDVMQHNAAILEGTPMATQALTDEALAAITAGVDLEAAGETGAEAQAEAQAESTADNGSENTQQVEPVAALDVLKGMLADTQKELAQASVQVETFKAQLEAQKPQFEAAIEVVRNSVRTMGLHFGVNKEAVAAMSATEVIAQHADLACKFKEKFKAGTVAATVTAQDAQAEKPAPAVMDARLMAHAAKLPSGKR